MEPEASKPPLREELDNREAEPLLPIEKKLIAWSLALGILLLGVLVWTGNSSLPLGR